MLPVGLGAPLVSVVKAGAGRIGGLGYRLADGYDGSLFTTFEDEVTASAVVKRLAAQFAEWYSTATQHEETVQDIRRRIVADGKAMQALTADEWNALREIEGLKMRSTDCMQHGDLHGLNVLVDRRAEPVVIDYGDVGRANACVDPVTLELSAIFHPAAPPNARPTEEVLDSFFDEEKYVKSSPTPKFVTECRAWATSAQGSEQERVATTLSYVVRQLKYGEATAPLARSIMREAIKRLGELG